MASGRLALCRCGSGIRYKHCHGRFEHLKVENLTDIPLPVLAVFARQKLEALEYRATHGVNKPISGISGDRRIVAVGSEIYEAPAAEARLFADFIPEFLEFSLGKEWLLAQSQLPASERSVLLAWRNEFKGRVSSPVEISEGIAAVDASGLANCWMRLGYDLFLIRNNSKLQRGIVERLKANKSFQGARFELAVTAALIASSFSIEYENESDSSAKHVEFVAIHSNGMKVSIEVKSRHREGVLGFRSETWRAQRDWKDSLGTSGILRSATEIKPVGPFVVFIEPNVPVLKTREEGDRLQSLCFAEIEAELSRWPNDTCPANGFIYVNDPSHFENEGVLSDCPIFCLVREGARHKEFNFPEFVSLFRAGLARRIRPPREFDGH